MKKIRIFWIISLILIIGSSLHVLAESPSELSAIDQKRLDAEKITPITPEQQAVIDKEMAYKASVMADYVPTVVPLNPYFIETAKKLNVNIEGLSDDEIMIKVKEAEVQYQIDHPIILTPQQQAEQDRLTAEKNALIH